MQQSRNFYNTPIGQRAIANLTRPSFRFFNPQEVLHSPLRNKRSLPVTQCVQIAKRPVLQRACFHTVETRRVPWSSIPNSSNFPGSQIAFVTRVRNGAALKHTEQTPGNRNSFPRQRKRRALRGSCRSMTAASLDWGMPAFDCCGYIKRENSSEMVSHRA